jgi:polyisoprenoid-binding protein YceI
MGWQLDKSHTDIGFSVRHMMISSVKGRFRSFDGDIDLDPDDPTAAKVKVMVDAASIDTGEEQRDGHLRSGDFLDVEKHPHISFTSSKIEKKGEDSYAVVGALSILGKSHEVTLEAEVQGPAKDPWGKQRIGVTLRGEIDRETWGLTWNQALEAGGILVGKKVSLLIDAQLVEG